MKLLFSLFFSLLFLSQLNAQKIFADDDVKAVNNEVASRLADNGQLTFSLLIKSFKFKLAEMQDHFNDQYLESTKFPRADFKGTILNVKEVNFTKDGLYKISVKGDLTLHGVTKNITSGGTILIKSGKPAANAKFTLILKDFNVDASSVSDKVIVDISCQYQ